MRQQTTQTHIPTPAAEYLLRGRVPTTRSLVRYVDEDAAGELRLIETSPERPSLAAH